MYWQSYTFGLVACEMSQILASGWKGFNTNRGSKCFGCLVSAEAHGDDGCQVFLGKALGGSGHGAAAWQHQGGWEVCSQSERGQCEGLRSSQTDDDGAFWWMPDAPHTWVVHMAHDPIHCSIDSSVAGVVHCFPAGLQRESHLTQLGHSGVIKDWSWDFVKRKELNYLDVFCGRCILLCLLAFNIYFYVNWKATQGKTFVFLFFVPWLFP